MNKMIIIDNFDSFTYNLVQGFMMLDVEVMVFRNNAISLDEAKSLAPTHLVISPGPGRPKDAGISLDMIKEFQMTIPILGVCLGHQCIIEAFGGKIVYAKQLMHGKTSKIQHDGRSIFDALSNPMVAGRYHSLAAESDSIPNHLEVSAETENGEIMGIRHQTLPIEGVQFHPESILTPEGQQLMHNFIKQNIRGLR